MSIGERIGLFASEKGINLRQLAIKADISYNTLYSIVKRKSSRVDYETMQKIADALEVSLSELIGMNPAVDIPENREVFDKAAAMVLKSGMTMKENGTTIIQGNGKPWEKATFADLYHIGALQFHSDEDRIALLYKCLNTDGMLAASKCFLQHLKPEDLKEVADYVEKLTETPQYQRPQETDEGKK